MAIDYAEIAAGAHEAIANAGMAMTLRTPGAPTYDPAAGATTATPADAAATGVLLPVGAMRGKGAAFGPDVLVRAQALIYLSTQGIVAAPRPGCIVLAGGSAWRVIGADALAPAGAAVLYVLAVTSDGAAE